MKAKAYKSPLKKVKPSDAASRRAETTKEVLRKTKKKGAKRKTSKIR